MIRTLPQALLCAAFVLGAAPAASATDPAPLRFQICMPSGPRLKVDEQKAIDELYAHLAAELKRPAGSVTGAYTTDPAACAEAMKAGGADVFMLSLDLMAAHARAHGLDALVQVALAGGTTDRAYLLAPAGPKVDPASLLGQTIASVDLGPPSFVSKVLLGGAFGAAGELRLKKKRRALRAVRAVLKGKAAAVLLDGTQYRSLKGTSFSDKLQVVYTSHPLPTAPVLVRASSVPASLSQELTRVLIEMKRHPQGRTLIELFGIDGFAPADAPALERVVKALETT